MLATENTDKNGVFTIKWEAKTTDLLGNTVKLYAKFEGNEDYRQSKRSLCARNGLAAVTYWFKIF